jgi:tRNA(Ile)-lysidine synthase
LSGKKILLTTSGGKDSGSLAFVSALDYRIGIAHCNFQLRGMEVLNQNFVQMLPQMIFRYLLHNLIPNFAEDFKVSTQVAARELRYNWFYELLETENLIIFLRHIMPMIIGNFFN